MKFMQTEKKQLLIYVIIAYGITYVMGLLMWYSYGKGFNAVCKEKQYDWVCYMVTFGSVYNWIRNKRYVF